VDTKPVSNIESETRPSDVESNVMAPASLKCTAYETGDLEQTVAAPVLGIHSGRGTPSGRHNKLQKLDRPVLMMRCSQQDFGFFKEELRRYATAADTTDDNLLQDQLLQCAEMSLRRMLQNTLGSTNMASISVAELLLEIARAAVENQSDLLNSQAHGGKT
jgi:hypothetical protein